VFQLRQLGDHLVDLVDLVHGLAGIGIARAGNQQFRRDLPEAVDDAVGAELRRAA
jgi:hypothetical protein